MYGKKDLKFFIMYYNLYSPTTVSNTLSRKNDK